MRSNAGHGGMSLALTPGREHLPHLDLLRFAASVGVVFVHARLMVVGVPGWSSVLKATDSFRLLVDLFFAISGFVIAYVYAGKIKTLKSYKYFLIKRVARLGPLHWALLIVFVIIGILVNFRIIYSNVPEVYDFRCLLPNLLFMHATIFCKNISFNGPSWSISAEMCLYIFSPLYFWFIKRRWSLEFAFLFSFIFISSGVFPGRTWLDRTSDLGFLRAIPSFLFGVLLFKHRFVTRMVLWPFITSAIFFLTFILGGVFSISELFMVILLYGIVVCAVAADVQGKSVKLHFLSNFLGSISYSIYMLHEIMLMLIVSFAAEKIFNLNNFGVNAAILICIILIFPASLFSYKYFEHPARQWLLSHWLGGDQS
jgi:peptidoglycan/LPS O-acetylase OafA/YrhL